MPFSLLRFFQVISQVFSTGIQMANLVVLLAERNRDASGGAVFALKSDFWSWVKCPGVVGLNPPGRNSLSACFLFYAADALI